MTDRLTEKELDIVRKYYQLHGNDIPEDQEQIPAFLDSLSAYQREDHYDDEKLTTTVSKLVDHYYDYRRKTISDEKIAERKTYVIDWIKGARDRQRRPPFSHYIGADAFDESVADFYREVFSNYYESIGCDWVNQ